MTHVSSGGWGGAEDLWNVCSGGCSVTYVPIEGWERRGVSLQCMQWGTPTHTCPQVWMREEEDLYHVHSGEHSMKHVVSGDWEKRNISGMYALGDAQ